MSSGASTPPQGLQVVVLTTEVAKLRREFSEHAKLDAEQLGALAAEITAVRNEQATKADTNHQTRTLAVLTALITALGTAVAEIIHALT